MEDLSTRDQQVMMAIVLLLSNAYGVSIQEKIFERTNQDLSFGTIYAVLNRLVTKGYVERSEGPATAARGGKKKLLYRVTGTGAKALSESMAAMDAMRQGTQVGGAHA